MIARNQAMAVGYAPDVIDNLLRVGRWQRLQHGVYATFSGQPSRDARLWAAVLRAGPAAVLEPSHGGGIVRPHPARGAPVHVIVPSTGTPA